ncbi:flagellar basal body P-ring protein FlgI [Escherichia albertii]|nr:flagellar basal body P-ring protein FlgI [Escherichia albertii]
MIKFLSAFILLLTATVVQADRIRDLTSVQGVRQNSLIGYGLVVGLDGTGDQTTQTPFTTQTLNNMLSQLGITVPTGTNMQLKNVAAVIVTASLPPFGRQGQTIDVVVSSMGNAKSLRGGTLLMTPLKGVDSQVYALAQGNLSVTVNRQANVSQPDTPFGGGQTVVTPQTQIDLRQSGGSLQSVRSSASLNNVVRALNALGATPMDLMSILQSMQSAGCLRAKLEII